MIVTSNNDAKVVTYEAIKAFDAKYVYWSHALDAITPPPSFKAPGTSAEGGIVSNALNPKPKVSAPYIKKLQGQSA